MIKNIMLWIEKLSAKDVLKFGRKIIYLMLVYFLIYNTIYGWNQHPINETEQLLDTIFREGITLGFIIFFIPVLWIYEYKVSKLGSLKEFSERMKE